MPVGTKPFRVELVTPERAWPAVECTFAALPGADGQYGVLAGRAPLVCKLLAGELRLEVAGGWRRYYVQGGFAEVLDDVVTVLTEEAAEAGELSADAAAAELAQARALEAGDEQARQARQRRIEQARAKLAIAARARGA